MSEPDRGGNLPADDSAGDEELYNPITYEQPVPHEQEEPAPEPDAWVAGDHRWSGGGVPVAGVPGPGGVPETGGSAHLAWAPAGWAGSRPASPQPPRPSFTPRPEPAEEAIEEPVEPAVAPVAEAEAPEEAGVPGDAWAPGGVPDAGDGPAPPRSGGIWPDESWPPRVPKKSRRTQWIVAAAAIVVVAGAGIGFALAGGSPAKSAPAAAGRSAGPSARPSPAVTFPPGTAPPLTQSAARAILSRYTTANNAANARMNSGLLGGYEAASSQVLDASRYTTRRATGAGPYPAYAPAGAQFYIPAEPVSYPHWFAVRVIIRTLAGKHEDLGTEYLLFTQSGPDAAWKDETEPYLLGGTTAPPVALDAAGWATAVDYHATGLAVDPSKLAQSTADSLDGHGSVSNPGNLSEYDTVNAWRARLPKGTAVSDQHTQTGYGIIGLRTSDGGALLFYTDAAVVTFTAPRGKTFQMSIPGVYSSKQRLGWAGMRFLDQLATYDPPQGAGSPRIVADYSGLQGRL
jgi:hypothetical protein